MMYNNSAGRGVGLTILSLELAHRLANSSFSTGKCLLSLPTGQNQMCGTPLSFSMGAGIRTFNLEPSFQSGYFKRLKYKPLKSVRQVPFISTGHTVNQRNMARMSRPTPREPYSGSEGVSAELGPKVKWPTFSSYPQGHPNALVECFI